MKKIIDGKRYDTSTAREVGSDSYSNPSDFAYWCETLYQKRNGEYFLHGEGGARSKYARAIGQSSWSGGEDIRPLTFEEARLWAEKHMSADEYEVEFGEIAEDDSRSVMSISLPASLIEQIKREAASAGVSASSYVEAKLR